MSEYTDEPIIDVEKRTKRVGDVLGDPTLFPVEFLNWLKRYIEQSGIQLPASAIFGGFQPGEGSVRNLAPGLILAVGGSAPPSGALPCNGAAVSRAAYPLLFAEIGTIWGAGDGSTTFNVPDLRDRALYGAGTSLSIGQTDGRALGSRGPSHKHTFSGSVSVSVSGSTSGVGDHTHGYGLASPNYVSRQQGTAGAFFDPVDSLTYPTAQTGGAGGHSHSVSASGSGSFSGNTSGGAGVDTPGHAGVLYVITTGQ